MSKKIIPPVNQHENTQNPSIFEKGFNFFCTKTFGLIFAVFLVFIFPLYKNIFGITSNFMLNWQSLSVPADITYDRFMIYDANLGSSLEIPHLNDSLEFLQFNRFLESADLTIIVGESGIGKSTAFKEYAKKLRKENLPVMYISIQEGKPFIFDSFLLAVFGTTDGNQFSKEISTFSNSATLIIDNIHLAKYQDNTLNTEFFTFLNQYLMQTLGMRIIMIASQNSVAYDINLSKFLILFYPKFLSCFCSFWI